MAISIEGGSLGAGSKTVKARMVKLVRKRLDRFPPGSACKIARYPVGLLFARGDRAAQGAKIAEQIAASYQYWSQDSAHYFDIIFPGWYRKGKTIEFSSNSFLRYRREVEKESNWRYSGETDFLLLNYEYSLIDEIGKFSFDEVIYLPVEEMLRSNLVGSLDGLMNEIVSAAKSCYTKNGDAAVWQISDQIGYLRGRKVLWKALKDWVLKDFAVALEKVEPFIITNLSK